MKINLSKKHCFIFFQFYVSTFYLVTLLSSDKNVKLMFKHRSYMVIRFQIIEVDIILFYLRLT